MPAIVRSSPNSSGCTLEAWLRACFLKRSRISRQSRRLWLTRRGRPCVLRSWTGEPGRLVNWAGTRLTGRRRASMLTCSSPTVSSTTFGRPAPLHSPGRGRHRTSGREPWRGRPLAPAHLTASARHGRMRTYVKAAPVISTSPVSSGCAWLNNWKNTSSSTRTVGSLIKVIACSYSGVCPEDARHGQVVHGLHRTPLPPRRPLGTGICKTLLDKEWLSRRGRTRRASHSRRAGSAQRRGDLPPRTPESGDVTSWAFRRSRMSSRSRLKRGASM